MIVEILQENLNWGLSLVSKVILPRSTVPILSNVFLSAKSGHLKLVASDMQTTISVEVGAKVQTEGEFTVPGKTFFETVNALSTEKVTLEVREGILMVKAGKFSAKINGISASEYPKVDIEEEDSKKTGGKVIISSQKFIDSLRRVLFCAASDEGRATLTGVLFRFEKGKLQMAATDGFRLSVVALEGEFKGIEDKSYIVPARALNEVQRMVMEGKSDRDGQITIGFSDETNQVWFSQGDIRIQTRLISGSFPEFEKIIPPNFAIKTVVPGDEFLKAIRLAAIFARDNANIIKLKISGSKLKISATAQQTGENETEIMVETEKTPEEELIIAFNFRYLLEFLTGVDSVDFSLELNGPLAPTAFKISQMKNFLHIIMPVRVQS